MCKWGTSVILRVIVPAELSHSGQEYEKAVGIDQCIAPLVQALNDGGIRTAASCCGHGNRPGNIMLADGRELIIAPDYETGRAIDRAFPDIWGKQWVDQRGPSDCFTACIASLTGLPLEEMPEPPTVLERAAEVAYGNAVRQHLIARGWMLQTTWKYPPRGYAIACGPSPRNPEIWHCVVHRDGQLVHDPHPSRLGISDVGEYEVLVRLVVT